MRSPLTPRLAAGLATALLLTPAGLAPSGYAQTPPTRVEVSADGSETVQVLEAELETGHSRGSVAVPFAATPDWENDFRIQVGALKTLDMNGDQRLDVVVGCYHSNSFPPYDDWHNFIYYNTGSELEAAPSWTSSDEVSTGDIQIGLINDDLFPDVFAANGGSSMAPSVIYFGTATGPSTTPGWTAGDSTWTNYARLFDVDHDGDTDVATANQGNSQFDPHRPMHLYISDEGDLETTPSWSSAETSIQNFLDFADYDGDGWEDLAVSKWIGFESGIYKNNAGTLATTPIWTTGNTDGDKGVGFADVDANGWPDLVVGTDPTRVYGNSMGTLSPTWAAVGTFFGHNELTWHDLDVDGDEDLIEIHFGNGQTHIYLNNGGTLETSPSWTYDSSNVGTAITVGDINGDQLPDLILGYSGNPSIVVFYNQGREEIFSDGFESGGIAAWTGAEP